MAVGQLDCKSLPSVNLLSCPFLSTFALHCETVHVGRAPPPPKADAGYPAPLKHFSVVGIFACRLPPPPPPPLEKRTHHGEGGNLGRHCVCAPTYTHTPLRLCAYGHLNNSSSFSLFSRATNVRSKFSPPPVSGPLRILYSPSPPPPP